MMGSYYEERAITPYSVGAIDQSMVDVASSTIQTLLSNAQALVTVIPWATEDDAAQWVQSLTPEVRYTLYPVPAQFLDAVTKAAFGQPVGFVAVLDQTMRAQPEQLFEGTPWKYFQSQAVFSERDPGEPPAIRFLYWANLRDEVSSSGTASTLEAKTKAAGATLVYPVTIPIQGAARGMPSMDFPMALASQTKTASASMTTPGTAPLPTGPGGPAAPTPASSSSGWGAVVLLASVAGLGGYVAYRVARGR